MVPLVPFESEQVIAVWRDQYVRGVIELDQFELATEQALAEAELPLEEGPPQESTWVFLAVEQHRREHTNV